MDKIADYRVGEFKYVVFYIALIWAIEIVNLVLDHQLNQFALIPRRTDSLFGVLGMHFLHWDLPHLISNTLPIAVLGFLVFVNGSGLKVTFTIMLLTGILVWLFARSAVHAGASGVVLGYWGYLLSNAYFNRSLKNIFLAIFTIIIYGGIVFSLVDFRPNISFEGHIFGFLAGVFSAWFWRKRTKRKK